MERLPPGPLRVATAEGPGTGRFLIRALLDTLESGADLGAITIQSRPAPPASWAIDFAFASGAGQEVIRASLDSTGAVVGAELLRTRGGAPGRRHRDSDALLLALRRSPEITALRLESGAAAGAPEALVFVLGARPGFVLSLGAFGPSTGGG